MEGILPLWKEKGTTSHDCVFKLRKILGTKKIGHGGTLDPDVEGVLPIAIGKATKVIEFMMESKKVYEGEMVLGISTTTEDASGDVVKKMPVSEELSTDVIDHTMKQFEGEITQIPPMYSAVRVKGKRLYEYARSNETVKRPERNATIYSFERVSKPLYNETLKTLSWGFYVACSKGTYVRTLAVDTGKKLGYPAHMSHLVRTQSGGLLAQEALTLKEVEEAVSNGKITDHLKPLDNAISAFSHLELSEEEWHRVKHGALLPIEQYSKNHFPLVFTYKGKAVALYDKHPKKEAFIKPKKVFKTEV